VYLGDGEHVCEANVCTSGFPSGVILRSVYEYCDQKHIIRARRPNNLSAEERLKVAFGAVYRIESGYDFGEAFQFWFSAVRGKGMWSQRKRRAPLRLKALLCSTLYQDALAFARHGPDTVRLGRMCTPAHLSASTDFEPDEPALNWLAIDDGDLPVDTAGWQPRWRAFGTQAKHYLRDIRLGRRRSG
jgi:hypothetical protein